MFAVILARIVLPISFLMEAIAYSSLIPALPTKKFSGNTVRAVIAQIRRSRSGRSLQRISRGPAGSSVMKAFTPCQNFRGFFAGSGSDGLNEAETSAAILELTEKVPSEVVVLYIGTATYDLPAPMLRQTARLKEAGCVITTLNVTDSSPSVEEMEAAVAKSDIALVSGGNTLFAVDRWTKIGLHTLLRAGMERGLVLAGGSAGAICWFDGGHSDSMDPDTYKAAMTAAPAAPPPGAAPPDESSAAPAAAQPPKPWEYIRVPGLGFLPGLVCPHHDKTQSNGLLRAADFDRMLLRHPGERGLAIDHWAAVAVRGERYRVLSLAGREGSVLPDGSFSPDRRGAPGVWVKEVVPPEASGDGGGGGGGGARVVARLAAAEGRLEDLLRPAAAIVADPRVEMCRRENPS